MKFTTKTEYGLVALIYMVHRTDEDRAVTIKELVSDERFSPTYMEKIFQALRAAGIVRSRQGKQGGYVLARAPREIYVKEVIEALEGGTFDIYCDAPLREEIVCTHVCFCGVKPLWKRTKGMLDDFFGSITLEMLAHGATESAQSIEKKQVTS